MTFPYSSTIYTYIYITWIYNFHQPPFGFTIDGQDFSTFLSIKHYEKPPHELLGLVIEHGWNIQAQKHGCCPSQQLTGI